jgi:hypothetical protein
VAPTAVDVAREMACLALIQAGKVPKWQLP